MKKFLTGLVVALMALCMLAPSVSADTFTNQSDIDTTQAAMTAVNDYTGSLSSESVTPAQAISAGQAADRALRTLASHSFSEDGGTTYDNATLGLKGKALTLSGDIERLDDDIQAQDATSAQQHLTQFNLDINSFNSGVDDFNAAVAVDNKQVSSKQANYEKLYLGALIATAVLCAGTFLWAYTHKSFDVRTDVQQHHLARLSIAPFVGALITFVTYQAAKDGGTYFIAYGPVLIGGFMYLSALAAYRRNRSAGAVLVPAPVVPKAKPNTDWLR